MEDESTLFNEIMDFISSRPPKPICIIPGYISNDVCMGWNDTEIVYPGAKTEIFIKINAKLCRQFKHAIPYGKGDSIRIIEP